MHKCILIILFFFAIINMRAQKGWVLDVGQITKNYYGVTVANGNLGIVSSPEPLKVSNVILANVYDIYGRGGVSNFLNGFNILDCNIEIDGVRISNENIFNHTQQLNMKEAVLRGQFVFEDKAVVEYSYLAIRHLPYTGMMHISILPLKNICLNSYANLSKPKGFKDLLYQYDNISDVIELISVTGKTPKGRLDVGASIAFLFDENIHKPKLKHNIDSSCVNSIYFEKMLDENQVFSFSLIGSTISSSSHADPRNESKRLTIYACSEGGNRLLTQHKKRWCSLWQSDIEIIGDDQSQLDVRSMIYHLYSFLREDSGLSLSPMGLSGLGYNGHVFWDADIWMFPPILLLQPQLAKSMIEYRYNRLEAAKQNAYSHGFLGAMYPWESADLGIEETPVWALTGPFEHHITACVALAAWQYYCVTGDVDWLREKGYPIISSCAEFWVSRVEKNEDGTFSINNVVAADEYAENVDDNAFTNGAARRNLEIAVEAAKILRLKPNKSWVQIAKGLNFLQFADGVTCEHKNYNGEIIKQADVTLLAYPLQLIRERNQIIRDLEYYLPRFDAGPAMTHSIIGLLYARLGYAEKGFKFFQDSYIPNQRPPFGVLAEYAGGDNPYFATAAGGSLQCVMMGFGGLQITSKGVISKKANMPSHWKQMIIKGVGPKRKNFVFNN